MSNFVERFGPWALVTGASSGIGEAFARRLAEIGTNLVLVARREDRLRKLAENLQSQHSVSTRVVPVDLSQDDFLTIIERATADLQVGLLVNNAGIATTGNSSTTTSVRNWRLHNDTAYAYDQPQGKGGG
jgi:short-subunit dehydrogenase